MELLEPEAALRRQTFYPAELRAQSSELFQFKANVWSIATGLCQEGRYVNISSKNILLATDFPSASFTPWPCHMVSEAPRPVLTVRCWSA